MRSVAVVFKLCIVGAFLLSMAACRSKAGYYASMDKRGQDLTPFEMLARLRQLIMGVDAAMAESAKRGCNDFACIRSRMGARVSQQQRSRTIADLLRSCAHDPSCSPGKRSGNDFLSALKRDSFPSFL